MAYPKEIICPDCHKTRLVSYQQAWNVKRGHNTGRCQKCVTPQNGAKTRITKGSSPWNKGLEGYGKWAKWYPKGKLNPAWKGGVTSQDKLFRKTPAYIAWRKAVFERDAYTCQLCSQVGGKLHADHIKPFAYHKELRLDLDNGRTLCVDCHKKTDTYLSGALKYAV